MQQHVNFIVIMGVLHAPHRSTWALTALVKVCSVTPEP
jgi:hypothetical protein